MDIYTMCNGLRDVAPDLPLEMGIRVTQPAERGEGSRPLPARKPWSRSGRRRRRHPLGDAPSRRGRIEMRPTGWGGWLWLAPAAAALHKTITEYWSAGRFVGIYRQWREARRAVRRRQVHCSRAVRHHAGKPCAAPVAPMPRACAAAASPP
ncbi:MAG: hypothetical protein HYX38_32390 [Rhodospirillales bacterium]|nr:hypothetical protein [Rhodospirillales bacterium]